MASREGPRIEPEIRKALKITGPSTSNEVANTIQRDPISVYRCLLRMKKRGQVTSVPVPGSANVHHWSLT